MNTDKLNNKLFNHGKGNLIKLNLQNETRKQKLGMKEDEGKR